MNIFNKFFKNKQVPEAKAFSNNNNQFQLLLGDSSVKTYTPKELLQYNFGWVYTCNNRNATTLSTIPFKLYYKSNGAPLKWYKHKKLDKKSIQLLEKDCKKSLANIIEIEEHPAIKLLLNPNPRMNYTDMSGLVQSYLGLIGNAYIYIERGKDGSPKALYPLLSENVTAIVEPNAIGYGEVKSYKYTFDNVNKTRTETTIPAKDIIHFINYQPGNTLYGRGELEAGIACAEREYYYDQVENYLNKNNARPDFLVSYKAGMTENQQKEIQRMWYKKYGSAQNAGKPMITTGDVDVKQLGFSPRDMQFQMGRTELRREICAIYGVPESLVVINDANRASAESGMDFYKQITILPKLQKYFEKINEQLVREYDEDLFVWYDANMITSQDEMVAAQIDDLYLKNGVYGVTFVRDRLGIESDQSDAVRAEPATVNLTTNDSDDGSVVDEQVAETINVPN